MTYLDEVWLLPSGTELSIEAAVADLERAYMRLIYGDTDDQGLACDLENARELITTMAEELENWRG